MNKLRLRGELISKSHMLDNPEDYREQNVLCFRIDAPGKIREYCKGANISRQTLTLNNWSKEPTLAQKQKFFALVDRVAEYYCEPRLPSKVEKDEIYRQVVEMMGLVDENGETIRSVKGLDSKELSATIEVLLDWIANLGIDITELK